MSERDAAARCCRPPRGPRPERRHDAGEEEEFPLPSRHRRQRLDGVCPVTEANLFFFLAFA